MRASPLVLLGLLVVGSVLVACAGPRPRVDNLERLNRTAFALDDLGPNQVSAGLGAAADAALPGAARDVVGRVFENLAQPRVFVADLLQARPLRAAQDLARFVVDTGPGLLGTLDLATRLGLPRHDEDVGQAFCTWGVPFGPYVYFPVLGPSSAAEAVSVTIDLALAPADLLLAPLAVHASRGRQLRAIRDAHADAGDDDLYRYQRVAYRRDRLRQVRDEPAFVPPTEEELRDPSAYGTCGYDRPAAPPGE